MDDELIKKIADYIRGTECGERFVFYSLKDKDFVIVSPDLPEDGEEPTEEQKKNEETLDMVTANQGNYLLLPDNSTVDIFDAKLEFAESVTDDDLSKELITASDTEDEFEHICEENELTEDFNGYLEGKYYEVAEHWAEVRQIITWPVPAETYKRLFRLAKEIHEMELWNYFKDIDVLKINYDDDIIYCSVLGNYGDCYGFEFGFGDTARENLNFERAVCEQDETTLLPMATKNAYAMYYDDYDDIYDEAKNLVENYSGDTNLKGNIYPEFNVIRTGYIPKQLKTRLDAEDFEEGLEAILLFAREYIKKPRQIPQEEAYHLSVTINESGVKYRKMANYDEDFAPFALPKIPYEKIEDLQSSFKKSKDIGYFDVKVLPAPNDDGLLPFLVIFYNKTSDKILKMETFTAEYDDYSTPMFSTILRTFWGLRIPGTIRVKNIFAFGLVRALFDGFCKVEVADESPIDDIADEVLSSLTDGKQNF